jgi:hypothetical protein
MIRQACAFARVGGLDLAPLLARPGPKNHWSKIPKMPASDLVGHRFSKKARSKNEGGMTSLPATLTLRG